MKYALVVFKGKKKRMILYAVFIYEKLYVKS